MAVTDCEFMAREVSSPEKMEKFLNDPESFNNLFHFTEHDEFDVYDEVNPLKKPELSQSGKVVVITGGGRGIGRGIALIFAQADAKGIAICARTMSQLEETRQAISEINAGTTVYIQQVDVTSEQEVESFFENVRAKFGRIDVAVSNAAVNQLITPMLASDTESWWHEQTVNLKGLYLVSKCFMQSLNGEVGTLVNISSSNALGVVPYQSSYCVNKAGGVRLMEVVHFEAPNVRSFSLHPGVVDTDMVRKATEGVHEPIWHWTQPALAGATILWLTTPRAEFLRGRWISTNWNVTELEQQKDSIISQNLLKTAFNASLGVK